jgi:hypothetical protein
VYILIVNFNLKGISPETYLALCEKLAPVYANVPGLLTKVWLADEGLNTYGGVYTWDSREAMEDYLESEIFRTIATHPNLENVTARTFGTLEGPTYITKGLPHVAVA